MNLINLELGKWLYLIIYLFFPTVTLLYLIRTFGLEVKEDAADSIQRHIDQADYWANIAVQMMQSQVRTKSLESLTHTVKQNLDAAARLLETAVLPTNQHQTLTRAYQNAADKLAIISGHTTGGFHQNEPMTFVTRA